MSPRGKHSKPGRLYLLRQQMRTSLFRNSGFIMAATIVNGGVGFLYWTVIARTSTTHNVGLASAVVSAFSMTSLLTNIGIATLMIQALPSIHDRQQWSAFVNGGILFASTVTFVISIGIGIVLPLVSGNLRDLQDVTLYALFAVGAALSTAALALDAVFVASRRSEKMLNRNLFFGISKAVIVFLPLLVVSRLSTQAIVASWVIGLFLSVAFGIVFLVPSAHDYSRLAIAGGVRAVTALWRTLAGHHLTNLGGNLVPFILPILVVIRVSAPERVLLPDLERGRHLLPDLASSLRLPLRRGLPRRGHHGGREEEPEDHLRPAPPGDRVLLHLRPPGVVDLRSPVPRSTATHC